MGNRIACCRQKWFQLTADDLTENSPIPGDPEGKLCYVNSGAVFGNDLRMYRSSSSPKFGATNCAIENSHGSSRLITQHISEREPEDFEFDPSFNASRHALFITGIDENSDYLGPFFTNSYKEVSNNRISFPTAYESIHSPPSQVRIRRWSSCYTVYIGDGWIVLPRQDSVLRSVSIAIELLLCSELNRRICQAAFHPSDVVIYDSPMSDPLYSDVYNVFDERKFPLLFQSSDRNSRSLYSFPDRMPDAREVHRFIRSLFRTTFLGPQTAIVAFIFLERLVNAAELGLFSWTWRRQYLSCVLLASKVLDDQAVWNTDYRRVLHGVPVEDLNTLERHTLSLLQFNIDVPLAVYARYYFDLLAAGQTRGVIDRPCNRRLLTPAIAKQLQILPGPHESVTGDHGESCTRSLFGLALSVDPLVTTASALAKDGKKRHRCHVVQRTKANGTRSQGSELLRSSSCHARFTIADPKGLRKAGSSSMPPLSPENEEGPLILDEETDYVNTLLAPSDSLVKTQLPKQRALSFSPVQAFGYSPSLHGSHAIAKNHAGSAIGDRVSGHWHTNSAHCSSGQTNRLGFLRSVMGGDVAYTLLREAEMY